MLGQSSARDAWSRLALFLSRDVLERRYKERHGGSLSARKATEIISHLAQAREYFAAAESSGTLVRPLLQYYGVVGFARALILYDSPRAREATLRSAHGLRATWNGNADLGDLEITTSNGTFHELLEATRNTERPSIEVRHPTFSLPSEIEVPVSLPAPAVDMKVSLLDLLSRMPSMHGVFEEALQTRAHCHHASIASDADGLSTAIAVSPGRFAFPPAQELRDALGLPATVAAQGGGTGVLPPPVELTVTRTPPGSLTDGLPALLRSKTWGHAYVVEPVSPGWCLSTLSGIFVGSYVLSILVRYHATRWAALANHEKGDRWFPVLEQLRDVVQARFPELILAELDALNA